MAHQSEPKNTKTQRSQRTKSTKSTKGTKPGTERARDERRTSDSPRSGGGPWRTTDEQEGQRFGQARNDDAESSELAPGEAENDDDDSPSAAEPDLAAAEATGELESGGQRAGMRRGEKPRKTKSRGR